MSSRNFVVEVLDHAQLAARATELIASRLRTAILENGSAVLVPSAGRTPTPVYRLLRERYRNSVDWRRVHVAQMDEYRGIGPANPLSFAHYLLNELVSPLRVGGFTHFNDAAGVLIQPPEQYETALGRIDLVVHGIGRNGHIGFNEPGSALNSGCRYVRLARSTLRANFIADLDRQRCCEGITLGLRPLRAARSSLLLATGLEKAAAMRRACRLPPSNRCPASRLRDCDNVVALADQAAASQLDLSGITSVRHRLVPNHPHL